MGGLRFCRKRHAFDRLIIGLCARRFAPIARDLFARARKHSCQRPPLLAALPGKSHYQKAHGNHDCADPDQERDGRGEEIQSFFRCSHWVFHFSHQETPIATHTPTIRAASAGQPITVRAILRRGEP